ncbi:MmcQ/YjbR family DNA-binding protein [Nocardia carnea]|uniref:MmcQ/YjbR family DNA-binding protein n=1 Tax=Nocardia carnea TaxID=37328 RepID=UPI0024567885|nr:MmcQ/YjbR family DNA-binding protein [Nocardia carnea]
MNEYEDFNAQLLKFVAQKSHFTKAGMNGTTVQQYGGAWIPRLPGDRLDHPFVPGREAYKVGSKMFMLSTEVTGLPIRILGTEHADGQAQRRAHAENAASRHMDKRHSITPAVTESTDPALADDPIGEPYLLPAGDLRQQGYPVDPDILAKDWS